MTKTTVDWLVEQLPTIVINSYQDEIARAKQLHRQEILDAFSAGALDGYYGESDSNREKYYEETFKND
jgi:hypothetical protein